MTGNLVKSHLICFDFQKTHHARDVFYTLSRRFVRLGFRLNRAVHYVALYSVLGNGNGNEHNMAVRKACVIILCSFLCRSLQTNNNMKKPHSAYSKERELRWPICKISFSNFNAVLHILFGIFLTVIDKLNESNSREIRKLNIKSTANRRCHKRCCRCCLNCLLLLRRRKVCQHFRPSVFLFGCVVIGRLFALHSFVYSFLCRSFSCYCLCSGHLSPILTFSKVSKCIKT